MNKIIRYIIISFFFLLLFAVRGFATDLFYDPLITYFQNDYLYTIMPEINMWKLVVDLFFRYTLNSLISLAIIWLMFRNKAYLKLAGFFFMAAFILLIIVFVFLLKDKFEAGYLLPFYVRRFIIHPLFLLVLIPAFYYQKLNKK